MTINSKGSVDPDRFLVLRNGVFVYRRRVPTEVRQEVGGPPDRRVSLKTRDIAEARLLRDIYEQGDNEAWALQMMGEEQRALEIYNATAKKAAVLGFSYSPAKQLVTEGNDRDLFERLSVAMANKRDDLAVSAALGTLDLPSITVQQAYDFYLEKIAPNYLRGKSEEQKEAWLRPRNRAVSNFIREIGDLEISRINRAHATQFYEFWGKRIAPETGAPTHSASSGNRDIGSLKMLFKDFHKYNGIEIQNPFDGLSFKEVPVHRPPFPTEWIKDVILRPGALAGLNEEARRVVLIMIETGARQSEITSLDRSTIVLDGIPHISIQPRTDRDNQREIKTRSSVRKIPLVGVALAAAQKQPDGFPRYCNSNDALSQLLKIYFTKHNLFPTPKHKIYSFRHSFEDRMKEGKVDEELRQILMGHFASRPKYGIGGRMEWRQSELNKIVLDYDSDIV